MLPIAIDAQLSVLGIAPRLGCIECSVKVGPSSAALIAALDGIAAERAATLTEQTVAALPAVAATRQAYKALGKDPSRYRPAAEALLRRLAQGRGIYRINNVVDTNNLISLHTGFSIGTYDGTRLAPPVVLRRGAAGERYAGIGRGPLNLEGLPVLADRLGPFGSPSSDSERSMITTATTSLLMVIYGFGEAPDLADAVALAAKNLTERCGASALISSIVADQPGPH